MSNVLLLMSDEHNPIVSTPYGHPMVQTPHMQALALDGTVCEQAYCASPLCMPSRSAFMAGRWVHDLQTYSNCNVGMESFQYPTYGGVLKEQGVHTVHVGKTDVYSPASELGFSEMLLPQDRTVPGDTNHGRRPLTVRMDGAQRADRYGPHHDPFANDDRYIEAALAWIVESAPSLDQPWVLSVNINKPHFPQWVTQELWDMYPDGGDLPEYGAECDSAQHPYALDLRKHFQTDQFTEEHIRGLRRGYLGCVTYVDRQLGRLVSALHEAGLFESTNVIYTSDHGDMLGKFGMWWKCSLYQDSVRIPIIAAGPDFSSGARMRTPVSQLDLQASLFHCVGAQRPDNWAGVPLQTIGLDDRQHVTFAEYHGHGVRSGAYMVRRGSWKLIYCLQAPHLLFDLDTDPDELVDLAASRPDMVAELEQALRQICDPELQNERAHAWEASQLQIIAQAWPGYRFGDSSQNR